MATDKPAPMGRVKFKEDRIVLDHNKEVVEEFTKGQTYELPDTSCVRWITRGVAVRVGAPPEKVEPVKVEPVKGVAPKPKG